MVSMDEADWIININLENVAVIHHVSHPIHLPFKGQGLYPSCI